MTLLIRNNTNINIVMFLNVATFAAMFHSARTMSSVTASSVIALCFWFCSCISISVSSFSLISVSKSKLVASGLTLDILESACGFASAFGSDGVGCGSCSDAADVSSGDSYLGFSRSPPIS